LKLGKVVGNVVSTIKDRSHAAYKLMIVRFIDKDGSSEKTEEIICIDAANAGIGDTVLINDDGGAAQMVLCDDQLIIDYTIVGVIDSFSYHDKITYPV
jgi:microcompartment protein CcmK/EutM